MPDIAQPESLKVVERRLEGKGQGAGKHAPPDQPPKKVIENYAEVARSQPYDDRITILGIPVEQITPVTQAALAGLVSEINHLRGVVKRLERGADKRAAAASTGGLLEPDAFIRALGATLTQPPGPDSAWVVVLVHVQTYEDIRRSSGLLAANSALADVAERLREIRFDGGPLPASAALSAAQLVPSALSPIGYCGGSNLAGVVALKTEMLDTDAIVASVRAHLGANGYSVGGIDMALAITVASAAVGANESGALALARVDHLLRAK